MDNLRFKTTGLSDLNEESADMSYCLSTSDFLEEFFPIPENIEALQKAAKLPKGAQACKPKGINFNHVKGFTSERDLAERWVSGYVVLSVIAYVLMAP